MLKEGKNQVGPFGQAHSRKWQCLMYFKGRIGLVIKPIKQQAKISFVTFFQSSIYFISFQVLVHKRTLIFTCSFSGMAFSI